MDIEMILKQKIKPKDFCSFEHNSLAFSEGIYNI